MGESGQMDAVFPVMETRASMQEGIRLEVPPSKVGQT